MTDEMEERADDVRVLLETADVPPARVDLSRAVAAGRRVRRRRRYAGVAAATVLVVAGAAVTGQTLTTRDGEVEEPIGGPPSPIATPAPFAACTVRSLPLPRKDAVVRGVVADPTGRYVVSAAATNDGRALTVLWTDGAPQILKVSGEWVDPKAVNSSGVVVGTATGSSGAPYAWVYRDGVAVRLSGLGGDGASAESVNARGDVAGVAWRGESAVPVVWPAGTAGAPQPRRARNAQAWGIADDGTVVGTLDGGTPYLWGPDGAGRELPLPEGATFGYVKVIRGQWAAGWVSEPPVDRAYPAPDDRAIIAQKFTEGVPARWNLATGEVTTWPGRGASAVAVNASGWTLLAPMAPQTKDPATGQAAVAAPDGTTIAVPEATGRQPLTISDDASRLYGVRVATEDVRLKFQDPASGTYSVSATPELLAWTC